LDNFRRIDEILRDDVPDDEARLVDVDHASDLLIGGVL
jgi:hypothetical protein